MLSSSGAEEMTSPLATSQRLLQLPPMEALSPVDSHYTTPPPRTTADRTLWRLVIALYAYDSAEKLARYNAHAVRGRTAAGPLPHAVDDAAGEPHSGKEEGESDGEADERHPPTTEKDIRARVQLLLTPLERALIDLTLPPVTSGRPSAGKRSEAGGTRATSRPAVRALGGSVFEPAIQHPYPPLRHALLELLLAFAEHFSFAYCAPVAAAAAVGDCHALRLLLSYGGCGVGRHGGGVSSIDPNTAYPLTVAVQHNHIAVLHELLAPPSNEESLLTLLKPNYGNAFMTAVRLGNLQAMSVIGSHPDVKVSRLANNKGTTPLLYACRAFMDAGQRVAAESQRLTQLQRSQGTSPAHAKGGAGVINGQRSPTASTMSSSGRSLGAGGGTLQLRSASRHLGSHEALVDDGASAADDKFAPDSLRSPIAAQLTLRNPTGSGSAGAIAGLRGSFSAQQRLSAAQEQRDHWREVVCYLLSHPSVDVTVGYYASPLLVAVHGGDVELVQLLLMHPKIRPNRVPRPTTVLADSFHLLHHGTLPPSALSRLVELPIEAAVRLSNPAVFTALVQEPRVTVHPGMLEVLERNPHDFTLLPFLQVLAAYREDSCEGWAWRWRRRCVLTSALTAIALCVLNVALLGFHRATHQTVWLLLVAYATAPLVTLLWYRSSRYCVPAASVAEHASDETGAATDVVVGVADDSARCTPGHAPAAGTSAALFASSAAAAAGTQRISVSAAFVRAMCVRRGSRCAQSASVVAAVATFTPPLLPVMDILCLIGCGVRCPRSRQGLPTAPGSSPLRRPHCNSARPTAALTPAQAKPAQALTKLLRLPSSPASLAEHAVLVHNTDAVLDETSAEDSAAIVPVPAPVASAAAAAAPAAATTAGAVAGRTAGTLRSPLKVDERGTLKRRGPRDAAVSVSPLPESAAAAALPNESFSFPRPAAALATALALRRVAADSKPRSPGLNPKAARAAPVVAVPSMTGAAGSSNTKLIAAPLPPLGGEERAPYSTEYIRSFQSSTAAADAAVAPAVELAVSTGGAPEIIEPAARAGMRGARGTGLYQRSLAFLSYELLVPSRLLVYVTAFFVHLITLFPASSSSSSSGGGGGSTSSRSVGVSVVAALGLTVCVLGGAAQMTLWIALRVTVPDSLLSGRRQYYTGEEGHVPFEEYLL